MEVWVCYFTFRAAPTYPIVQHRIPEDLGIYSLIISFEWDLTPRLKKLCGLSPLANYTDRPSRRN
jgi:hypothetical protein